MNILALLETANSGYPDGFLSTYYDKHGELIDESSGDGLACFIVAELIDTFDSEITDTEQLEEAVRVMSNVRDEISEVLHALNTRRTNTE